MGGGAELVTDGGLRFSANIGWDGHGRECRKAMSDGFRLRDDSLAEQGRELYRKARHEVGRRLRKRLNRPRPGNDVFARVPLNFEVMAYFSERPIDLYQIRQWLYPLEQLNERHPVCIVTRNTSSFRALTHETHLPVINALRIATIDAIVGYGNIKMCVYVNQAQRNFQALRYPDMMHVFMSHGESDKSAYMASNQLKAYDFTFIAGDAALERIKENLVDFDVDTHTRQIGRPQLDKPWDIPAPPDPARKTVLYAPTWEGDRPSIAYGSVESHGRRIVETLTNDPKYRVIYRPHPRTGATLRSAADEDQAIRQTIEQAARRDPSAGHRVDLAPLFGPQMDESDLMITDVSAVAIDYLPTGKPLVITIPTSSDAPINRAGMIGSCYELPAGRLGRVPEFVADCLTDDPKQADRERWVQYYFGDVTPGASTKRFLDACEDVIVRRDERYARKLANSDTVSSEIG